MLPRLLEAIPKILLVDITRRLFAATLVSQLLPSSNVGLLTAGCGITLRACRVHSYYASGDTGGCTHSSGLLANGHAGLGFRRNGYAWSGEEVGLDAAPVVACSKWLSDAGETPKQSPAGVPLLSDSPTLHRGHSHLRNLMNLGRERGSYRSYHVGLDIRRIPFFGFT